MKAKGLYVYLGLCFLYNCQAQHTTSRTEANPEWVVSLIARFQSESDETKKEIVLYTYKGKDVYLVNKCMGCNDNLITVYSKSKVKLCEFGGLAGANTCPDFELEAKKIKVIWSPN